MFLLQGGILVIAALRPIPGPVHGLRKERVANTG